MSNFFKDSSQLTRKAATIGKQMTCEGIGIHTGEMVTLTFSPAPPSTGVIFIREKVKIPARLAYVVDTTRSTSIEHEGSRIHTVEHVLAAVKASRIDNLYIELSNIEPPAAEGSSLLFTKLLKEAGRVEQNEEIAVFELKKPIYYEEKDILLFAIPSPQFQISYTLSYADPPILRGQFFSFQVNENEFETEVAPSRTFCKWEEISYLMDKGLIRGGSLDNAVVIKGDAILSKKGLFYPNEMARHKALDLLGDLSLMGKEVSLHVVAIRSGHRANVAFAKILEKEIDSHREKNS